MYAIYTSNSFSTSIEWQRESDMKYPNLTVCFAKFFDKKRLQGEIYSLKWFLSVICTNYKLQTTTYPYGVFNWCLLLTFNHTTVSAALWDLRQCYRSVYVINFIPIDKSQVIYCNQFISVPKGSHYASSTVFRFKISIILTDEGIRFKIFIFL